MNFRLLDSVVLAKDLPAFGLKRGDLGAVVEVYEPDGLEVEFVTASGQTGALVTLKPLDVRSVVDSDLVTVRQYRRAGEPPVLPDVLKPGLEIVFCGTAVGGVSARRGAYYAGKGNRFWQTLAEVNLTPREFTPEEFWSVADCGLGLTDLAKRRAGSDRHLSAEDFDREGLRAKILQYRPSILAFTSKRAAEAFTGHPVAYGRMEAPLGTTLQFVLPSPSASGRRWWSIEPWFELARLRREIRQSRVADSK